MSGYIGFDVFHLDSIDADGSVFNVFSGLAFGFFHAGLYEGFHDIDGRFMDFAALCISESAFDFFTRKFLDIAGEEGFGDFLCLGKSSLAMDETGDFFGQFSLGISVFRMFCHFFLEIIDFFVGQEGEVFQVFHYIPVILIEPELIEFVGGSLLRIEPYGAAGGLAEFRAVRFQHERNGETEGIMDIFRLAEKVYAVRNISPLICPADLELHIVMIIEHLEIDGLKDLIGKFGEGNTGIQTGSHHFLGQHGIDIEKFAIIAKEIEEGNLGQPVIVVHHGETVFAEKFLHLVCQAFRIVLDDIHGLEDPFRFASGRIADGARAPANDDDRMMAGQLEPFQDHKWNQMTDVHAVPGRIDTAIEGNGLLPYQFVQSFLVRLLIDSATPFQFINNIHRTPPFSFFLFYIIRDSPCAYVSLYHNWWGLDIGNIVL